MIDHANFTASSEAMEEEFGLLDLAAANAKAQREKELADQVERARQQAAQNTPAGDWNYHEDLASVWRSEAKRGPYKKRSRPQSRGVALTPTERDVIEVLAELSCIGRVAVSNAELSNRVGKHADTVRLATKGLAVKGLLLKHERRTADGRNRPNVFNITPYGWTMLNRRPPIQTFAKPTPEKIRHPSEDKKNTSTDERSAADAAHNKTARSAPNGAARSAESSHAPTAPSRTGKLHSGNAGGTFGGQSPDASGGSTASKPLNRRQPASGEALARAAAKKLLGSQIEFTAQRGAFEMLDLIRQQHLSRFDNGAWSRAEAIHGRERALLAVAVALLRQEDGQGRPIRSRASYLGQMLRRPPAAMNPAPSLHLLV